MPIKEGFNMTNTHAEQSASQMRASLKRQLERANALDPELLECRVGGTRHRWTRVQPDREPGPGQKVAAYQCDNCLMIKRMTFGARYGEIISRSYEAPEGYHIKREFGEIGVLMSGAAVRLALADRSDLPPLIPLDEIE